MAARRSGVAAHGGGVSGSMCAVVHTLEPAACPFRVSCALARHCVPRVCQQFMRSCDAAARPLMHSHMSCVLSGLSGGAAHVVACITYLLRFRRRCRSVCIIVCVEDSAAMPLSVPSGQRRERSYMIIDTCGAVRLGACVGSPSASQPTADARQLLPLPFEFPAAARQDVSPGQQHWGRA